MKRYLKNLILFCGPCLVCLLAYYLIDDPYRLYWPNEDLYEYGERKVCCNDAYRGIRWMNQYDDSLKYNSFILGSSRSYFYYVDQWKQYLGQDASCFHFGQSGDNLFGTQQRLKYLYSRVQKIDNIMIIMDAEYLADDSKHKGIIYRQPWQVTPEWDYISFNWEFIKAFYTLDYQKRVLGLEKEKRDWEYYYIEQYNELHKSKAEYLLENQPDEYFKGLDSYWLYKRSGMDSIAEPVIFEQQKEALMEIGQLLKEGNTNYRIVINPLYEQVAMNQQDLDILYSIFGRENVFDFSGINEYTNDTTNYYETSHYRPKLCNQIMKVMYN